MRHPVSRSLRTPRWRVHRRGARSSGRADAHLEHPARTRTNARRARDSEIRVISRAFDRVRYHG